MANTIRASSGGRRSLWVLAIALLAVVVTPLLVGAPYASESPQGFGALTSSRAVSPQAKRARLHAILDRAKGPEDGIHDACIDLLDGGDASSVPHIIRVLSLFPDVEIEGKKGVGIVCTQGHCVKALERITGTTVGVSYSSWKRWWQTTHPHQPLPGAAEQPAAPAGGRHVRG
jgi:hypothetical protein